MKRLPKIFLTAALVATTASLVPTLAFADDPAVPAPTPPVSGDPSAPGTDQNPATVTVTATVAPDQCQPLPGGPSAGNVADSGTPGAGNPEDSVALTPEATPGAIDAVAPSPAEVTATGNAGPTPSSRFDPYTCAPVTTTTTAPETGENPDYVPPVEDIPTYTPTLNPYPGGTETDPGDEQDDPLASPTPTSTIAPPTTTGAR